MKKDMELPISFCRQVETLLGTDEAGRLFESLQGEPLVSIRLNAHKPCEAVPEGVPVPWCEAGRYLPERPSFTFDPAFHAGAYYVQEASSMFLALALRRCVGTQPVRMLDLCAAPGGKSTLAANALPAGSWLVANEVMRNRAQVLAENLTKWGCPHVMVTNNDPADFTPLGAVFDIILVDAPCSGEGMFRKDPVAVSEWSEENVDLCARRQRRILADIWPCLKPGGYLIYSTCTFNQREDEENVRWMRDEWGAEPLDVPGVSAAWGIEGNLLPGEDFPVYRFLPHCTRGEGFFLALLRKPGEAEMEEAGGTLRREKARKGERKSRQPSTMSREVAAKVSTWLALPEDFEIALQGQGWAALPRAHAEWCRRIGMSLRVLQAGVPLGEAKGRDLVPAHALAMSTCLRPDAFPCVEVARDQAIAYLRREAISLPADAPRGFVLLTWQGLPLGFVKNIGNRANNLYPPDWRIRSLGERR